MLLCKESIMGVERLFFQGIHYKKTYALYTVHLVDIIYNIII